MAPADRATLAVARETDWKALNAEKRGAQRRPEASVRERIDAGVALSAVAVQFRRAVREGRSPART